MLPVNFAVSLLRSRQNHCIMVVYWHAEGYFLCRTSLTHLTWRVNAYSIIMLHWRNASKPRTIIDSSLCYVQIRSALHEF